ncbi:MULTISPECIES: hypothetical protein [unclassified Streptomyces]|uniref:hypothetical protein n=1 Tax=unclassified Streptomyces TaxID=2593676 RepID=UPI0033E5F340
MAKEQNTQDPRTIAQELLSKRLDAVDVHAANMRKEQEAREALAAAARETARSWAELIALWSTDELRRMGFKEPAVKAPGRPRRRTQAPKSTSAPDAAPQAELPSQNSAPHPETTSGEPSAV